MLLQPYGWNVTAPFHIDTLVHKRRPVPPGTVVLDVPAYDGAQYYQIARTIPLLFTPERWPEIRAITEQQSYAYQRFLLPLSAYVLALGQEPLLPYAFLAIHLASLILTGIVTLRWKPENPLYALALAFSPAAMVGLHFSLAEPQALLLYTLFLTRYSQEERIRPLDVLLLSLIACAREVSILFIALLIAYSGYRGRWRDILLLLIPVAAFAALHGMIYLVFRQMPFFISSGNNAVFGSAVTKILLGLREYNVYTLSSIALFTLILLPAGLWNVARVIRERRVDFLACGTVAFIVLMLFLSDNIWGSITSVGRVITPLYPLIVLSCATRNTLSAQLISSAVLAVGLTTAVGMALIIHPYHLA